MPDPIPSDSDGSRAESGIAKLARNEVHVWSIQLNGSVEDVRPILSVDEIERATRFRFARDRNHFAIGRGLLRIMLSEYVGRHPERIQFVYGPYGKPALADARGIVFNISHSGGRALMAFARDLEIGVDLEALKSQPADKDVAKQFFSPYEVQALFALPESEQEGAFFRCWTRKEAFIKARGDGLSLPLHDFDVVLDSSASPALLRTAWSRSEPARWSIFDLSDSCPGYVAALAVRARKIRVSVRDDLSSFVGFAFEPGLTAALASASQVAAKA